MEFFFFVFVGEYRFGMILIFYLKIWFKVIVWYFVSKLKIKFCKEDKKYVLDK